MENAADIIAELAKREADIMARRDRGETLASIAAHYGIGTKRVSDIIKRANGRQAKEAVKQADEAAKRADRADKEAAIAAGDLGRIPVGWLELSIRSAKRIEEAGFATAEDVAFASDNDLRKIPGFGAGSLKEVRDCIAKLLANRT